MNTKKYITLDQALEVLDRQSCYWAADYMELIPAADVRENKRGKWKLATYSGKFGNAKSKWYDQFFDGAFWYCDSCEERANKRTNYCPSCGADMTE